MQRTVYLPDDIDKRAKDADLNLSGLLRNAVTEELKMIEAKAETLNDPGVFEVGLEDGEGRAYIGRVTGALIAQDGDTKVFLTEEDANWFIKRKQHDYPKLYTYVESLCFCPQMIELRGWIKSLSQEGE